MSGELLWKRLCHLPHSTVATTRQWVEAHQGCRSASPATGKHDRKALISTSTVCSLACVWPVCTFPRTRNAWCGPSREGELADGRPPCGAPAGGPGCLKTNHIHTRQGGRFIFSLGIFCTKINLQRLFRDRGDVTTKKSQLFKSRMQAMIRPQCSRWQMKHSSCFSTVFKNHLAFQDSLCD